MTTVVKRLEAIVEQATALGEELIAQVHRRDMAPYRSVALGILIRALRSARGSLLLCQHNLTDEAMMLGRSIFEFAVTLEYVKQQDSDARARLFLDYAFVVSHRYIGKAKEEAAKVAKANAAQSRLSEYSKLLLADEERVRDIEQRYQHVQQRFAGHEFQWAGKGKDIAAMAEEVGLGNTYKFVYSFLSERVHGGVLAVAGEFEDTGADAVAVRPREFPEQALALAAAYLLDIMAIFNEAWDCKKQDDIDALFNQLKAA